MIRNCKEMEECYNCDCWDNELEQCTMPSIDRIYACKKENK